jgi:hypothetical protein
VPDFLGEALQNLQVLMKSYDISLAPESNRATDFEPILSEALIPFLGFCETSAKDLEPPTDSIFMLNCLFAVNSTLAPYEFTHDQMEENKDTIEEHVSKLEDYQHAFFLHTSGVHPLLDALSRLSDSSEDLQSIASLSAFRPDSLIKSSQVLDHFLPSALLDATENLKGLSNLKLIQEVTTAAAERFAQDFDFVQDKLEAANDRMHEVDGEDDTTDAAPRLRELYPRTSSEIRILLS